VPVGTLAILEHVHLDGRGGKATRVSLRLDERAHERLTLAGHHDPQSGGPTMAAYLDTDRTRLHAWLDPVSGRYAAGYGRFSPAIIAALSVAVAAFIAGICFRLGNSYAFSVMACAWIAMLMEGGCHQVINQRIEAALRAALPAVRDRGVEAVG